MTSTKALYTNISTTLSLSLSLHMTRLLRSLGEVNSSSANTTTTTAGLREPVALDSDFVVILAALLCALICVLGLAAVARCAWLRRLSTSRTNTTATTSPLSLPPPPTVAAAAALANKGLKKKILKSLPKLTFTAESAAKFSSSECAICLSEFAAGDEILVLPQCSHTFHVACIETWLGSHSSCPSCRQILVVATCQKCGGAQADTGFKDRTDDRFLP
ncbi:RING-H2 finger protein ATL80 [Corylus avellana]|uniref:RING-H2 finger protein ATL80 n=1 Tax=Corylus avellana TaxID=13451 RepID=UPI00286AE495|nr:RING-H2 finger protein ATL80 [Corylus avellana]